MLYWVPRYTKKNFTAVGPWRNPLYAFNFRYLESRVERINNSDKFASDCSFELNNHIKMTAIMTLCGANQVFRVVRPLLFEIFTKNRSQHQALLSNFHGLVIILEYFSIGCGLLFSHLRCTICSLGCSTGSLDTPKKTLQPQVLGGIRYTRSIFGIWNRV